MKKIFLICIFLAVSHKSKVLAQEKWYISPGVQIGIDSKGNLHRSAQVTLGFLIEPFTTGLTIGYKWFRKFDKSGKKSWNRYNYYDLQSHTLESIIQPGIGFGFIQGDNNNVEWFLNGLQGDLALFECDNNDAYCLLARIDRDLIYQEIGLPNELDTLKTYTVWLF